MFRNSVLFVLIVLFGLQIVRADMAPPDGYVNTIAGLILTTKDDLSGYRFFVVCGGRVQEVIPIKDQQVEVTGCGMTPQFAQGTLYGVPRKSVAAYPATLSDEQMRNLSGAFFDKKVSGAIELLRHGFRVQIKKGESVSDAEYRLSKIADGIQAERLPSRQPVVTKTANEKPEQGQTEYGLMIGGGLLLTALVIGLVLLQRSSRKQNVDN